MTATPVLLLSLSPTTGESINPRVAGLIGRSGPQNKQPFMVAFFKATEVHLRSIRSATGGTKPRNNKGSKGAKSQEALRVANVAGKHAKCMCFVYIVSDDLCCWLLLAMWGINGMGYRWPFSPDENPLYFYSTMANPYMQTLTSIHNNTIYLEPPKACHWNRCDPCTTKHAMHAEGLCFRGVRGLCLCEALKH